MELLVLGQPGLNDTLFQKPTKERGGGRKPNPYLKESGVVKKDHCFEQCLTVQQMSAKSDEMWPEW